MDETLINFPIISAGLGALAYGFLSLLLLSGFRGSKISGFLILTGIVSTIWFALQIRYFGRSDTIDSATILQLAELARAASWFLVLGALLILNQRKVGQRETRLLPGGVLLACALLGAYLLAIRHGPIAFADYSARNPVLLIAWLALAVAGLVLIEQIYRNTRAEQRWAIKYLCIGAGALFAYDFYLYADAILFRRIDLNLLIARGAVNALAVPLIAVAAARNRDWETNLFVSRQIVFRSGAVVGAGAYLLLMSAAGYYLRAYGGSWGGALQIVFLFAAVVLLVILLFSGRVRGNAKLFVARHFYRNKYEYGEEWLKFTRRLSTADTDPETLKANLIAAVADIMASPGGLLWERDDVGRYVPTAGWNHAVPGLPPISADHPGLARIATDQTVIDLRRYATAKTVEESAPIPAVFTDLTRGWLLLPVCHGRDLVGLIVLMAAVTTPRITREDVDLLATVGRQAASYLVLLRTTERLAEARQFETFNKLAAFLVHDLKNVIAQLSLLEQNAVRHRQNPEFVDDAFKTVGSAVARMQRMLSGLRQNQPLEHPTGVVRLDRLVTDVVARRAGDQPQPQATIQAGEIEVLGDAERLASVIEHLVQNAQQATPDDGRVEVELHRDPEQAVLAIRDTGSGMDKEFIDKRLFRPFDSTKGNAGMGIGVYESRYVVQHHGGRLEVDSTPSLGTTFTIYLPLHQEPVTTTNMISP